MQEELPSSSFSVESTCTVDDHHSGSSSGSSSQESQASTVPPLSATVTVTMTENIISASEPSTSSTSTNTSGSNAHSKGNAADGVGRSKDDHSTDSSGSEQTTSTSSSTTKHHQRGPGPKKPSPPKDLPLKNGRGDRHDITSYSEGQLEPPLAEVASGSLQAYIKTLDAIAGNGNGGDHFDDTIDDSYYNKLPHWSQNITHLVSIG